MWPTDLLLPPKEVVLRMFIAISRFKPANLGSSDKHNLARYIYRVQVLIFQRNADRWYISATGDRLSSQLTAFKNVSAWFKLSACLPLSFLELFQQLILIMSVT
jgi:hypothetical protein